MLYRLTSSQRPGLFLSLLFFLPVFGCTDSDPVSTTKSSALHPLDETGAYYVFGDILLDRDHPGQRSWAETGSLSTKKPVSGAIFGLRESWVDLWPDHTVPYYFTEEISASDRAFIRGEMDKIEDFADVRFEERDRGGDYIYTIARNNDPSFGGWSTLGYTQNAEFRFKNRKVVIHELLHGLGLSHEHNRPDRDDYITVNWDNLGSNFQSQFQKTPSSASQIGPYDYSSIMHYALYDRAWSGRAFDIIYSDLPSQGNPDDLQYFERPVSEGDIAAVRALYPERNPEPEARIAGTNTVVAGTTARWQLFLDNWEEVTSYQWQYHLDGTDPDLWYELGTRRVASVSVSADLDETLSATLQCVATYRDGTVVTSSLRVTVVPR